MGDDLGLSTDADSPWAGDVPASAPTTFEWSTAPSNQTAHQPANQPASRPGQASNDSAPTSLFGHGDGNVDAPLRQRASAEQGQAPSSAGRTKMFVAVAVLGVLGLVAINLIAGRDDSGSSTDASDTSEVSVPDSDAPPATDGQLEPAVTEPSPTTTAAPSQPAPDDVFPGTGPLGESGDPTWTKGVFAPPAALRDAEIPTTIVLVTSDGVLRELDMASGQMVELEIGPSVFSNQMVVGRSSTLISGAQGAVGAGTAVVYRAGERPIDLGGETGQATFTARPSSDEFVGFRFGVGPDDFRDLVVSPDGVLQETPTSLEDVRPPWLRRYAPNGSELFSDGGSIFAEDAEGSVSLLTSGELLASSSHHMLVRECDATHVCTWSVIDGATTERQVVQVGPEFVPAFVAQSAQLSPDGSKLWFSRFDKESSEFIMDLTTGTALVIASGAGPAEIEPSADRYVWTADSAGVIRSTTSSLEFVDATTGERSEFADEFANPIAFGVRLDLVGVPSPPTLEPVVTDIQLAGYGEGAVYFIDVDTGDIARIPVDEIQSEAPVFVVPDQNGVSVVSYDNVDGVRVEGDVVTPINDGPFSGPMVAGLRPDTLWVPGDRSSGGLPGTYDLFDSLGRPVDGTIRLPKNADGAAGSDGQGGVVAQSAIGGAYAIGPNGVERITTGQLLALGSTTAVADECDDDFVCGVVVIDRLTGERTALAQIVLASVVAEPPQTLGLMGRSVSPNGDVALMFNKVSGEMIFVDLVTGEAVPAPTPDFESTLVWSADGGAAVYLSDGRLRLYDRSSSSVRLLDQFPQLRAVAELPPAVPVGLVGAVGAPTPSPT